MSIYIFTKIKNDIFIKYTLKHQKKIKNIPLFKLITSFVTIKLFIYLFIYYFSLLHNSYRRENGERSDDLNENNPQRLTDLNAWTPGSVAT